MHCKLTAQTNAQEDARAKRVRLLASTLQVTGVYAGPEAHVNAALDTLFTLLICAAADQPTFDTWVTAAVDAIYKEADNIKDAHAFTTCRRMNIFELQKAFNQAQQKG